MAARESLKRRLRALLKDTPNSLIFPPEPWYEEELEEIAKIVSNFVAVENSVVNDYNPWAEWLDRYYFHQSAKP
jgi:hypothetical protein